MDKLAKELIKPMNKRDVLLLNLYTTLWGLWVTNPIWDTFAKSKIYASLEYIFPEYIWGGAALLIGVFSIYAAMRNKLSFLKVLSKFGAILWLVISLLYVTTDYSSTGWITAFVISTFYFLKAINISINKCQAFNG